MKKYYLDSGCSSLLFGIKNFSNTKIIFLPEFICNNLPESLKRNKFLIRYYKIKKDLKTDWSDLKNGLRSYKNENILLLYVNFFSKINERSKFIELKKYNKIKLIEDNSHGFYLNPNKENFKKIDLLIASPKKIFSNLYGGGILYKKKNSELDKIYKKLPHIKINFFNIMKQDIKNNLKNHNFFNRIKILKNKFINIENDKSFKGLYKMDLFSKNNLQKKKLINEFNKKKNKIIEYKKILSDFSYDEIADYTNSNNIPWYFSIIAKTDTEKKTIVKFCSTKQIINFNWPDLPKKNINKRTKSIYNKLICFPL